MVLRVYFGREDLGRIRLATGPALLWEVVLSLHRLSDRDGALVFDEWRRRAAARLPATSRWLLEITRHRCFPVFLRSGTGAGDLDNELSVVLPEPRGRIRSDLAVLGAERSSCGQAPALAEGADQTEWADQAEGADQTVRRVGAAVRDYHGSCLAPYWPQIQIAVNADLTDRARDLAHAGADRILSSLHPRVRWQPPVLELPFAPDQDLRLGGRGLLLQPAFFCWGQPVVLTASAAPVLVLPVEHDLAWLRHTPAAAVEHSLEALVGRTRALILTTIAAGSCTTTQLAGRAGVSVASASQHAAVLRDAGLITTRRSGGCVMRTITPLGATLIKGSA
jgi:hypothetical protein